MRLALWLVFTGMGGMFMGLTDGGIGWNWVMAFAAYSCGYFSAVVVYWSPQHGE